MLATPLSHRPAPAASTPVALTRDRTSIRVCPVPRAEPPTDDEMREAGWDPPASGTPTLPLSLPRNYPPAPLSRPDRRADVELDGRAGTTGSADHAHGAGGRGSATPTPTVPEATQRRAESSAARTATRLFLATCLEIVGGYRPVTHLRPFCRPEQFPDIANQVTGRVTNPSGRFRGRAYGMVRAPSPLAAGAPRSAGAARSALPERIMLRRVQASEAVAGTIEVAVVLTRRDQVWAMAFRLEEWRGRWLCSCLEVL